jgi:hypothetical protein
MPRKIAKFFVWLIGGALGLAVVFYFVVLAINWRDVPPSEEALRFAQMYANRPQVADEQNAFVYMIGMSVAPVHDPKQAGVAMIEAARKNTAEGVVTEYSHPAYQQTKFTDVHNKETQEFIDSCKSLDEKCLALNGKPLPDIQLESMDAVLLNRYRDLVSLPEWQDIYHRGLSGPMPSFGPAMSGQILSILDIWRNAESRGAKTTIAMLDADARFWRKVLVSSDSLITSMVAVAALKKNLYWTNVVIRRLSSNNITADLPPIWLNPITDEERSMESAWVGEWAMGEHLLRGLSEGGRHEMNEDNNPFATGIGHWLGLPLLQIQDTINLRAEELSFLVKKYNVKYEELPTVVAKFNDGTETLGYDEISFPDILYNPVGKVLNFVGMPTYPDYMNRVFDLEGGRLALLIAHQLRSEQTPREKIKEALAASSYCNPYTNQPFVWDDASQSIVFEGLDTGKRKRYSFPY